MEALRAHVQHFLRCATGLKDFTYTNVPWDKWITNTFIRSLPHRLGQHLLKQWEAGNNQTWPAMAAIALTQARFMEPHNKGCTPAGLGPDDPASSNAGSSTISEGSNDASSSDTRYGKAKRQRQLKQERLSWSGDPRRSSIPPTDATTEALHEAEQLHTGIGIRSSGSSTFFVSQYGTHSIVNNGALLLNTTRLDPPALFAPPGAEDHPEARLIKATHVGLLVLRRSGGINISIPEVYLCPQASNNLIGTIAMTRGKFSYDPDAHVISHGPSKARFLVDDVYRSFTLPHYGPGLCFPAQMEDGVSYCLDVCKVDHVVEEGSRALSPTPELNEIDEVCDVD